MKRKGGKRKSRSQEGLNIIEASQITEFCFSIVLSIAVLQRRSRQYSNAGMSINL